jgi:Protein of unknown function (DUF2815)
MKTKAKPKETEKEVTRYLTPLCRVSYCNVWKPRKDTEIYDISLIMDNPKDLSEKDKGRWNKLKELMLEAKQEEWPKAKAPVCCNVRTVKGYKTDDFYSDPLDGEKNPEYVGKIVIKATSYGRQPEIIGPDKEEITNKADFYSGCYAIASLTAFAYDKNGKKGVSFGVQHIMKIKDGTSFTGGAGKAADHFEEIDADDFATTDEEDEDEEDYDL